MSSLKSLLFLASLVAANPVVQRGPKPTGEAKLRSDLGTAIGGALDLPTTITQSPSKATGVHADFVQAMTITIVNSHGDDISTVHAHGPGPSAIAGNVGPGRMGNGQSSVFVVPAGWNGNVAVNDAAFATTGDESLIEGSFVNQGNGGPQGDINVSYVNGFSAAIVCRCNENGVTVGCNKNLFNLHQCANNNGQNSCRNPNRYNNGATQPTDFFRPCFGYAGAYTFPNDGNANQMNQRCPSENYTCCIGMACAPNPNQNGW